MSAPTVKALDYSTPDTVRERLEARLRADLVRLGSCWPSETKRWPSRSVSVGEMLARLSELAPTMASEEADRIGLVLNLVHPAKLRPAVLERLLPVWPWWTVWGGREYGDGHEEPVSGFEILRTLLEMEIAWTFDQHSNPRTRAVVEEAVEAQMQAGKLPAPDPRANDFMRQYLGGVMEWPSDVATLPALLWVSEGLNRLSKGWGSDYEKEAREQAKRTSTQLAPISHDFGISERDPEHLYVLGNQFAWAYGAVAGVERGQRERAFKLPANKHANVITAMFVRPPSSKLEEDNGWTGLALQSANVVLTWDGKATPYQLELHADADGDISAEIARGLIAQLGPDALRDWLALYRITSDQGSSGRFRWTWEEHRERTHYAARVRNRNERDDDLARATRQRIWRFKQAELIAEVRVPDGRIFRRRIGPFGLVDVDREILEADGKTPSVVGGRFNPVIYGSRGKGRAAGFTLLPEAALRLPSEELRIAVSAFIAMRAGAGATRMKARTLWDYAGLTEGQRKNRRRWPQCRTATERTLDALSAIGIRWTGGGALPDDVYELTAPEWWTDRLVRGVGPVLTSPATAGVPRTGLELAAMRKARGLSQRALGNVVGASQATVHRAEKSPEALPAAWLPKLAEARLTMP